VIKEPEAINLHDSPLLQYLDNIFFMELHRFLICMIPLRTRKRLVSSFTYQLFSILQIDEKFTSWTLHVKSWIHIESLTWPGLLRP